MTRVWLLGALALLASSQAHASRARELVMGTGDAGTAVNGGSLYYASFYNIFYNPAYVNDFGDWAVVEKSNYPGSSAQGGFFGTLLTFGAGIYLNRGNSIATYPGIGNGGTNASFLGGGSTYNVRPVRPVELYFGGDAEMKWGLGLTYASNTAAEGNSNYLVGHTGLSINGFDPFFSFKISESDVNASHSFYRVGFRYQWDEWIPYAVAVFTADQSETFNTSSKEITWGGGIARNTKVAEGIALNYAFSFWKPTDSGSAGDATRYIIPVDLSIEGALKEWITLRAGLSHRLVDRIRREPSGTSLSVADGTTGRIGASLHFNQLTFDWAVGKTTSAAVGETAQAVDSQTFDLSNGFFTAASLAYRW